MYVYPFTAQYIMYALLVPGLVLFWATSILFGRRSEKFWNYCFKILIPVFPIWFRYSLLIVCISKIGIPSFHLIPKLLYRVRDSVILEVTVTQKPHSSPDYKSMCHYFFDLSVALPVVAIRQWRHYTHKLKHAVNHNNSRLRHLNDILLWRQEYIFYTIIQELAIMMLIDFLNLTIVFFIFMISLFYLFCVYVFRNP